MQQFDSQFIDRSMQPLLMRIFTDIADGKENPYLQKLLAGEEIIPLKEEEKKDFINDYFLYDKTKPFSTTSQEDTEFQNAFLDSLSELIRTRSRLSGVDGARQAFFPDKEKRFDEISIRNIYDLAYKITLNFEKAKIGKLIAAKGEKGVITEAKASQDQALLESGRLRLVNVNGTDQYISEEEARASVGTRAGEVGVIPLIAIGTSGQPSDVALAAKKGKTADEVALDSAAAGPVSTKSKPATITEVAGDFKPSKKASIEMMMEKNGLEVVGEGFKIDEKGIARGKVKDADGQLLFVEAETIPVENDPQKYDLQFKFTFADDTSKSFKLNQSDLRRFRPSEKERKSAAEVGFGERPKPFKEKKLEGVMTVEAQIGAATVEALLARKARTEGPKAPEGREEEAYRLPEKAPAVIPSESKGKEKAKTQGVRAGAGVSGKQAKKSRETVMARKKRLAEQPTLPGQPSRYARIPGGPSLPYGEQPVASAKKNRWPLIAGIATGGSVVGGVGGVFLGAGGTDSTGAAAGIHTMLAGAAEIILKITNLLT